MECSTCGAPTESGLEQCGQCISGVSFESIAVSSLPTDDAVASQASKLIEFPGVTRSTVPQWRKELSERVREVQEKRAREEALELTLQKTAGSEATPQLELLPQAEMAPINPLVAAALRRIERAHEHEAYQSSRYSSATAVAYAEPEPYESVPEIFSEPETLITDFEEEPKQVEKAHNLVVVPPPPMMETVPPPKPRRVISDVNDPALNYLDSVRTTVRVETTKYEPASIVARVISALVDLIAVGLTCVPFAAALELFNADWQSPRVWILTAGMFSVVGFIYLTVSTALTGRTFGQRLLSLRVVDLRTGLIPTGTQSAGRALLYLPSLLVLGISSISALLNSERMTVHDRITGTAVVQG